MSSDPKSPAERLLSVEATVADLVTQLDIATAHLRLLWDAHDAAWVFIARAASLSYLGTQYDVIEGAKKILVDMVEMRKRGYDAIPD